MGIAQNPEGHHWMWLAREDDCHSWLSNRRVEAAVAVRSAEGSSSLGSRGWSCWAKERGGSAPRSARGSLPTSCGDSLSPLSPAPRRLHSNHLYCDCHLAWLSDWLRQRRTVGPFTLCMAPVHLRGFNVADVQKKEYVCSGEMAWLPSPPVLPLAHL